MPFGNIKLNPGVNSVWTPTLNEAGVSDSNLIRWRFGLPEKLGGWTRYLAAAQTTITRALHAWQDYNSTKWLAVGNEGSSTTGGTLNVITGGSEIDISPQVLSTSVTVDFSTTSGSRSVTIVDTAISGLADESAVFLETPVSVGGVIFTGMFDIQDASGTSFTVQAVNPATSTVANGGAVPDFSTVLGSNVVTVTFANHGLSVGSSFEFPIPTTVGGLTIQGIHPVASVPTTGSFTIILGDVASATENNIQMNGGEVSFRYIIGIAEDILSASGGGLLSTAALGKAALGQFFVTINTSTPQEGTPITASGWSLDNWGSSLVASPTGGAIYYWPPNTMPQTALPIGTAPPFNTGMFIALPEQIMVAYGSATSFAGQNKVTQIDPLIVRWSDVQNFAEWRARIDTLAGSFRLSHGSKIVHGLQAAKTAYLWTDVGVWTMEYVGYPLVFGFDEIGTGCGLLGPSAACEFRGLVYWVSEDNFYITNGGQPQILECPVWDTIFQDLDPSNTTKVVAAPNSRFNEIFFFYPSVSGGTGECDKYVKYNVTSGLWDIGQIGRSAWVDTTVLGPPIGADPSTLLLQQHETSYNADGSAMNSYIETGYFVAGDGENFVFIDEFQPDMKFTTANSSTTSATLGVTLTSVNYPNDAEPESSGSLTMTSTTEFVTPRTRGRMVKWKLESSDSGSWWRLGNIRYRWSIDGRR